MYSTEIAKIVKERVSNAVANGLDSQVAKGLVDHLVQSEVDRRVKALVSGFDLLEKSIRELRGIKHDIVHYDDDGNKTGQYSDDSWKKRSEVQKKIDKMNKIIDKAISDADYGDLFSLTNGK